MPQEDPKYPPDADPRDIIEHLSRENRILSERLEDARRHRPQVEPFVRLPSGALVRPSSVSGIKPTVVGGHRCAVLTSAGEHVLDLPPDKAAAILGIPVAEQGWDPLAWARLHPDNPAAQDLLRSEVARRPEDG